MTNIIKRKSLLSLMAVVVMIAMMSIACKNKVTASANLSTEAGTEEVIGGAGNTVENIVEGTFASGDFKATVKNAQITIEYKDAFGGQGPLVINSEGKTPIKAKNSRYGFNFIIDGVKFLATDATPNYDANCDLVSIVFSGYGQTKVVKFSKKATVDNRNTINEGSFASGDFKATVKNSQIAIEYKDLFGGQGPLVIKAEGKTSIKAKNKIGRAHV